jgi:murein DD-endopeptidase MepM/ murein hydrolase activator NlpD
MRRILVVAGLVLLVLAGPVVLAMTATIHPAAADNSTNCASGQVGDLAELDAEQSRNASLIVTVGQQAGIELYGLRIALATAMQESRLRNLDYGDRDSLGLFQQRPSAGWGLPDQLLDPVYAARAFYGGPSGPNAGEPPGLLDIPGWQNMALTDAAQAVQRSAFPGAYARWETNAAAWLAELVDADELTCTDAWVVPIAGDYTITARFGQVGEHWSTTHTGIDLAAPIGREVLAATSGQVTYAGWDGRYGRKVEITHTDGTRTWYAHLSVITVRAHTTVTAGDVIGRVGMTGNATGPHLHFEVRPDAHGRPIDPQPWMAARQAVL